MWAQVVGLSLLVLTLSGSASAAAREDLQIFRDISRQVEGYPYFTIFDTVHVGVENGMVVLSGKVTMPYKSEDIAKRVANVDGVRTVRNRIQVLSVSQFDDELRVNLARALYAHPALAQYGLGPNPSIHIVVERGRVTLDGVVNSDADRTIASSIARSFSTFGFKNELKTDEEIKKEMERL